MRSSVLKKSTSWSVFIYGSLVFLLGIFGYFKTQSLMSLYTGGGIGLLLILNSLAMLKQQIWSGYTALALTILLTAVFALRYSSTGKSIPAIMSVISGGMLLFLMAKVSSWSSEK